MSSDPDHKTIYKIIGDERARRRIEMMKQMLFCLAVVLALLSLSGAVWLANQLLVWIINK